MNARTRSSRPLHYILVDGSASMRGAREVFARGLALALAKKLSLVGGKSADVWVRFFDSRLHPRIDLGRSARRDLPRLLSFRSQRGRNYARVFADLAVEVGRLVRDESRDVAVTFITHGTCQIPVATVKALAAQVRLYGIFVLPSGPLELDYLPLLHRSQVVTAASLGRTAEKRRRALEIVEDARTSNGGIHLQAAAHPRFARASDAHRSRSRPASGPSRRSARGGRARRWSFIRKLLKHDKTEGRHYEAWLDGTAATYIALGRGREAGYVLLTLGRYGDAQRHFPVKERPLEWALCAARMGRRGEAARVFSEMGHPALAAIQLEAAGAAAAARLEWERVLRDERLAGRPYETALAHLSLGEALVRIGDRAGGLRELGTAARLLEVVADEYETGGRDRARVRLLPGAAAPGQDMGSFETVAEGYLNIIRIMATLDQDGRSSTTTTSSRTRREQGA